MNLGEISIDFIGSFEQFEKDIASFKSQAIKAAKDIERNATISYSIDFEYKKALQELRKDIEKIEKRGINIKVNVDDSALNDLEKRINNVNRNVNSGNALGNNNTNTRYTDSEETIAKNFEKATNEFVKEVRSIAKVISAPFAGVGTGFFEGIGRSLSAGIGKNLRQSLESQLNFSFKSLGTGTGDVAAYSLKAIGQKLSKPGKQNLLDNVDMSSFGVSLNQNDIRQSLADVRKNISDKYKLFKKSLDSANYSLAQTYGEELLKTSEAFRQQIEELKKSFKFAGENTKFGSFISNYEGSTKGNLVRTENLVRKGLTSAQMAQQYSVGTDVVKGVALGLSDKNPVIRESASLANTILVTLRKQLGIESPSKIAKLYGIYMGQGLSAGLKATIPAVASDAKQLANSAISGISTATSDFTRNIRIKRFGELRQQALAMSSATEGTEAFYDNAIRKFGKKFRREFMGGMSAQEARGLQNEIAGFLFSGASMVNPALPAIGAAAPLALPLAPVAVSALGIANIITPLVDRITKALTVVEPIQSRLKYSTGSFEGADKEVEYVQGIANKYNVAVQPALENYSKLLIAGNAAKLQNEDIKKLFEGISASLGATKLSTQEADLAFYAYTQMVQKGKISMEELRQQLGEKFPATMDVFAKALGISTTELDALATKGALISQEVMPKLSKVLLADYGSAAANQMGSFSAALTKLENVGFEISVSLAKDFGGLFAAIVSGTANTLSFIKDNLKVIQQVAGAALIGIAAQVAVGIQAIVALPAISGKLASMQAFLVSSFKASIVGLTPFFIGVIADVTDDWLGAQHSLFDNMANGFAQMFTGLFGELDRQSRAFFDKPLFNNVSAGEESVFTGMMKSAQEAFKILPSGLVEITAIAVMSEQLLTLIKMLGTPVFNGLAMAATSMAGSFKTAFTSGDSLKGIFRTLFSDSVMLKGAMTALGIASKLAFASLIVAFARSDFGNPLADSFGKIELKIITSLQSIKKELSSLRDISINVGKSLQTSLTLPSKGLELNPGYILGLDNKSFKSDDFFRQQNEASQKGGFQWFGSGISDTERQLAESYRNEAKKFGLQDYFTGREKDITLAQKQLLTNAKDLQSLSELITKRLADSNLTPDRVNKFISGDMKKTIADIKNIDDNLQSLGKKRVKIALIDSTESKIQLKEIDKEINVLVERRKTATKPLESVLGNIDTIKAELDNQIKAIANSDLPNAAKTQLTALLKAPQEALAETMRILTGAGLYEAIKPLESAWQGIVDNMRDAEKSYSKMQNTSLANYQQAQVSLYSQNLNSETLDSELARLSLGDLQSKAQRLERYIAGMQASLEGILAIANVESTDARKEEIATLRENIIKGTQDLNQSRLDIAKQQYQLIQQVQESNKAIRDYYQSLLKQSKELYLTAKEINNEINLNSAKNKLRNAITGFQDNFVSQYVDSLISILDTLNQPIKDAIDATRQLSSNRDAYIDSLKQVTDLQRKVPTNISGSFINQPNTAISSKSSTGVQSNSAFVLPIPGMLSRQTSGYGDRIHPITGIKKFHDGRDYGFSTGTPVVSPMSGVVTGVRHESGGAGKYIVIEALDGKGRKIEHTFMHLDQQLVKEGVQVAAGQIVGKVGNTGGSTGAHLHWRTRINGKSVDPLSIVNQAPQSRSISTPVATAQQWQFATQASFYGGGDGFHGQKTATGEIFDENKLTTAINATLKNQLNLKYGTSVEVYNPATGKSVIVRVNDAGPYETRNGKTVPHSKRGLDLSLAAARQIGLEKTGVGYVNVRVVNPANIQNTAIAQSQQQLTQRAIAGQQEFINPYASSSTGYSQSASLARENLNNANANIVSRFTNQSTLARLEANRALARTQYQAEQARIENLRSTTSTDRLIEDVKSGLGLQGFGEETDKQVLSIKRKYEDLYQQLESQRNKQAQTLSDAQATLQTLLESNNQEIPFRDEAIAQLQKIIPSARITLDKLNQQIIEAASLENKEIGDLADKTNKAELERVRETQIAILEEQLKRMSVSDPNSLSTLALQQSLANSDAENSYKNTLNNINELISKEVNKTVINLLNQRKQEALKTLLKSSIDAQRNYNTQSRQIDFNNKESDLEIFGQVLGSRNNLVSGRNEYLNRYDLGTLTRGGDETIARNNALNEYKQGQLEIEKLAMTGKYTSEQISELRFNLEQLNEIKLDSIRSQFNVWEDVMVSTKQQFSGLFSDLILGTGSLSEALGSFFSGIASNLANLASEWLTNELFAGLFGLGTKSSFFGQTPDFGGGFEGGSNFLGMGLGLLGGLFGFAHGGIVPNYGAGGIAGAMQRERSLTGRKPVLAVLSAGERVLNHAETKIWNQINRPMSFASGGIVDGMSYGGGQGALTINVPITVPVGGNSQFDKGKENALRQAIIATVIKEREPGGSLYNV